MDIELFQRVPLFTAEQVQPSNRMNIINLTKCLSTQDRFTLVLTITTLAFNLDCKRHVALQNARHKNCNHYFYD